ncbi:O-methyltransferase [Gorillibacterium timonense]|uniref:O-methyltransferase n=1 Tax=Gorillibacterium timonense TaxID=1689269 RepID=UPI00071E02DC|nr:O-methyltransferase [Gorillibacterium timonense]
MDSDNGVWYAESLYPPDEQLQRVLNSIRESGMPEISVSPGYGRLLTLLVQMTGARSVLEIGALGGYSGICLARGLTGEGRLLSLELREDYAGLARENLQQAGFADRAEVRVGDALKSLDSLLEAGERFDFFFIDADKVHAPEYLERALLLAKPGTIIVGDNAFYHGKAYNPENNGPGAIGIRRFNERMASDPRLESTLLPAYDGMTIARVK